MSVADALKQQLRRPGLVAQGEPLGVLGSIVNAVSPRAQDVATVAFADVPGQVLLDPLRCPVWALDYCATAYGTRDLPANLTVAEKRAFIDSVKGWARGRQASVEAAVKLTLTGMQSTVYLKNYSPSGGDGQRGHFTILVRDTECPDPTRSLAFLNAAKIVWHAGHLVVRSGPTWAELPYGVTWNDVATGLQWDDVTTSEIT